MQYIIDGGSSQLANFVEPQNIPKEFGGSSVGLGEHPDQIKYVEFINSKTGGAAHP